MTLEDIWTTHTPASPPKTDWAARTHQRRRRRRALSALGELLGGAGAIGVALWFVAQNPTPSTIALLAIVGLVVGMSWAATARSLAALARARAQTTGHHLERLRHDAQIELRAHRGYTKLLTLSAALTLGWAIVTIFLHAGVYLDAPWRAVVGLGGILAILMGVRWQVHHKIEALEDELQRLEAWTEAFQAIESQ